MLNEEKDISDTIKSDVDRIWKLFLDKSYSTNSYFFGNDVVGYVNLTIKFNHINNYYSNITIDKFSHITINVGIPTNGKENRIKEKISHELTHVIEIIGLNGKEYPKYNKIKKSLIEFKNYKISKTMDFITDIFYKTLDNEINANVAQTYIYLKNDGRCSKEQALEKLKEWEEYKLYDNIKKIDIKKILLNLNQNEVDEFNNILISNDVKTISSHNIEKWLEYWFKIFKRKSEIFIKNSEIILKEIEKDWKKFESYVYDEYDSSKLIDYSKYISNFNDFNDK